MKITSSLELVRYIRHHLAGSEFQDVKAVEDFVKHEHNKTLQELINWCEPSVKGNHHIPAYVVQQRLIESLK